LTQTPATDRHVNMQFVVQPQLTQLPLINIISQFISTTLF